MQLAQLTLSRLAEMICGQSGFGGSYDWPNFPYRSSSKLTRFFHNIELDFTHRGETRQPWVLDALTQLNRNPSSDPRLPSDDLVRVIQAIFDPVEFNDETYPGALASGNKVLARDNLKIEAIDSQVVVSHIPTGVNSTQVKPTNRPLSTAERLRREKLLGYLQSASEDDFTSHIVVPLFQHLGFCRVKAKGHRDKSLEYGKDVWMKFILPTDHVLYCAAQVKIGRIHASTGKPSDNVASILNQAKMALTTQVFDADTNSNHLIDHVYLISSGEITEQARLYLSTELARTMQRQLLFVDQEDVLRMWALTRLELPQNTVGLDVLNEVEPF